jgi:alpha-beta hydrolase superfamily lysophospholipase
MTRNRFALGALFIGLALAPLARAQSVAPVEAAAFAADITLQAPDGRAIPVSVWPAADERGVIVFSHGLNAAPQAYETILSAWAAEGFTVIAPLHVDSLRHPDHADYDNRAAFGARIADLAVARGFVKATRPGKPVVAAGHSFGSLLSLIAAGAVTAAGPLGDPDVKAVVALSSAGDLPGLVTPQTYAALITPTLMITGDADTVPGYAPDWRAHRSPFDRSPVGDKMLMIFAGGDHSLVRDADADDRALIVSTTTDFMRAHALGDAEARARLEGLTAPDGVVIERR